MCASGQEKVTVEDRGVEQDVCSPLPVCPLCGPPAPVTACFGPQELSGPDEAGVGARGCRHGGGPCSSQCSWGVCMDFQGRRGLCNGGVRPVSPGLLTAACRAASWIWWMLIIGWSLQTRLPYEAACPEVLSLSAGGQGGKVRCSSYTDCVELSEGAGQWLTSPMPPSFL